VPRFFFHLRNTDGSLAEDRAGQERPDELSVREWALNAAREIMADELRAGIPIDLRRMSTVLDERRAWAQLSANRHKAVPRRAPVLVLPAKCASRWVGVVVVATCAHTFPRLRINLPA
jgi:hypothetical protein